MSWICDGVPKDGKNYPGAIPGGHSPYENTGPDCNICGLPQESMEGTHRGITGPTTIVPPSPGQGAQFPQWLIPVGIIVGLLVLGGGGFALYQVFSAGNETTTNSSTTHNNLGDFISSQAKNSTLISQGEKILLDATPEKNGGAQAFGKKDWDGAIDSYQQASSRDPNDPESKIYLNNAKARKAGTPLTIAVVVPISSDANSAKEVLRGVAKAQEEFNQSASNTLLEVAIADDLGGIAVKSLAQDLINDPQVLGVIGHGIDPFSKLAIEEYENAGLVVLSPLTSSVTDGSNPTLKTISLKTTNEQLLVNYLQSVAQTLSTYANSKHSSPPAIIFYNSDSPYSKQLRDNFVSSLPRVGGKIVKEIDVKQGLNAQAEISAAKQAGAKVAFLALNKGHVNQAIAIAQANAQAGSPLMLLGGDELYSPDILVDGGDGIKGIVLAVPWSFQPDDPFAIDAIKSWKGRVSWRTATAYDTAQVLGETVRSHPNRSGVNSAFKQGVPLNNKNTNLTIFDQVPLVVAKPGSDGPPGSKYEFAPL